MVTRRLLLAGAGAALAAPGLLRASGFEAVPASLDHLILGINDLDRGIAWVERRSGVRAVIGGVHPSRGTRNALLSLGQRRYLEIMAPDPAQPASSETRGLSHLSSPRIIGWASHLDSAQSVAAQLTKSGIAFTGPRAGSRKRPDGRVLDWQTVELKDDAAGTLPFFIEWGAHSPHPSEDSPPGLTLLSLEAGAPDPTAVLAVSTALGLGLHVGKRPHPSLRAGFRGPRGKFTI